MITSAALVLLFAMPAAEGEVLGYLELRGYGLTGQAEGLGRLEALGIDVARAGVDPDKHSAAMARLRPTAKLHLTE